LAKNTLDTKWKEEDFLGKPAGLDIAFAEARFTFALEQYRHTRILYTKSNWRKIMVKKG